MPPRKKATVEDQFPRVTCGTCKWWAPVDRERGEDPVGMCCAEPPKLVYDGDEIISARPMTEPNEPACAYFKANLHA